MLKEYNDLPDERRYPFVVPANERMPTPSRRLRMRRKAGLTIHWDDFPDNKFLGYDPGCSDDEDEDAPPPSPPRVPGSAATGNAEAETPSRSGSRARAVTEAEPEPAEPKAKRRKVWEQRRRVFGENLYEGSFRVPRYKFDIVHRYGYQLVRTCTQHTRTPRIYFPYYIYLLSLFVCCRRLQHRTDAVFVRAFVALLLSLL